MEQQSLCLWQSQQGRVMPVNIDLSVLFPELSRSEGQWQWNVATTTSKKSAMQLELAKQIMEGLGDEVTFVVSSANYSAAQVAELMGKVGLDSDKLNIQVAGADNLEAVFTELRNLVDEVAHLVAPSSNLGVAITSRNLGGRVFDVPVEELTPEYLKTKSYFQACG